MKNLKYGLLGASNQDNPKKDKPVNIGDDIQALAIYRIYKMMGISDDEIIYVDFHELKTYNREYVVLPINFNLQTDFDVIPFNEKIIPCFIGLSLFATVDFSMNIVEYLKKYEPIGCRDEQTMILLRKYGIAAYLSGCVTITYPLRDDKYNKDGDTIFLVDLSNELKEALPKSLHRGGGKIEIISHLFEGEKYNDPNITLETARNLIKRYRDEAKLVITSRLHCLSPCLAMGIPVIGLFSNITPRMGWIDKLIPLYTIDDMDIIDWNGKVIHFEDVKDRLIDNYIRRIQDTYNKYNDVLSISTFFENRKKTVYGNYYYKMIKKLPYGAKENFSYIIWGCGQIGLQTIQVMNECFPHSQLIGAIDSYTSDRVFSGLKIEKPENIKEKYMDIFCIITTYSGEAYIKKFFENIGKKNYLSLASVNG